MQTDCQECKYWHTNLGSHPSETDGRCKDVSRYATSYMGLLQRTKNSAQCWVAKILKIYQILMYKNLRVGTHLTHTCSHLSSLFQFFIIRIFYVYFFFIFLQAWHANQPAALWIQNVCVNFASTVLGFSHDGLPRHGARLPVLLGAAFNEDKGLSIQIAHPNRLFPAK